MTCIVEYKDCIIAIDRANRDEVMVVKFDHDLNIVAIRSINCTGNISKVRADNDQIYVVGYTVDPRNGDDRSLMVILDKSDLSITHTCMGDHGSRYRGIILSQGNVICVGSKRADIITNVDTEGILQKYSCETGELLITRTYWQNRCNIDLNGITSGGDYLYVIGTIINIRDVQGAILLRYDHNLNRMVVNVNHYSDNITQFGNVIYQNGKLRCSYILDGKISYQTYDAATLV